MSHACEMKHAALITRALRWLRGSQRCVVVVADMEAANGERVDAMGWTRRHSVLVEAKISRADFHADKRKPWRLDPPRGVGLLRYYMAPVGVLSPEDMPPGWGLVTVSTGGQIRRLVKATPQPAANRGAETWLLCNAARAARNPDSHAFFAAPVVVQGGRVQCDPSEEGAGDAE